MSSFLALEIAFRLANGDIVLIPDNLAEIDVNTTAGVIDLTFGGESRIQFYVLGRVEEMFLGPTRTLRITAKPGNPPQGYFRNNSTLPPRSDLRVFATSSTFATIELSITSVVSEEKSWRFPAFLLILFVILL